MAQACGPCSQDDCKRCRVVGCCCCGDAQEKEMPAPEPEYVEDWYDDYPVYMEDL